LSIEESTRTAHGMRMGAGDVRRCGVSDPQIASGHESMPGVLDGAVISVALALGEVRLTAHAVWARGNLVKAEELCNVMQEAMVRVAEPGRFPVHGRPLRPQVSDKIDRARSDAIR
jgi:hypothetical protein